MPIDAAIHGAPMHRESPVDHHFSTGRLPSPVSLPPSLPTTVMTLSRRMVIAVALVLMVMVALVIRDRRRADTSAYATSSVAVSIMPVAYSASEMRDRDIEFYTRRAAQDRESAADRAALAALHLARGSATGATTDLDRAEQLARESIQRRTARNGQAFELLATALMARHAFREARTVMQRADSLAPDTPSHLALLGEIELELGEYEAAKSRFTAIHFDGEQFTIGARLARWYELTGHVDIARQFLTRAIRRVALRDDLPRPQVAWFHYRLGELELRVGQHAAADSAFRASLAINHDDARALGGLARVAAAQKRWSDAITYGAEATAVQLDPATIGTMSVAYAALGDSVQSESFARAMAVSALRQPGAIHRAWGLFLLDHGTVVDRREVLRRARRELSERHDVYGHDLLAWALFRNGRVTEARSQMAIALSQQTEDVLLTAHALAIGIGAPQTR